MRNLFLILTLLITLKSYSQDTVKIPQDELEEFFLAVDTLKQQDSIKSALISDLEYQIKNYTLLSQQDSLILNYKEKEILILKDQIILYDNRLNQVDKWYKKPWVGFVGGFIGTLVTIHIIDYSLPR
jgi:hypothetical protein|tara:strand:- start:865 stop:1245 length:381 start_codon:yes stop_codon:yes gene_type:complete